MSLIWLILFEKNTILLKDLFNSMRFDKRRSLLCKALGQRFLSENIVVWKDMQSAFFICTCSLFLVLPLPLSLRPISSEETVWGKTYSWLPGVLPWLRWGDPWPSPSYMTWLTAFHLSLFLRSPGLWSPSAALCVTPCFLYPSVLFKWAPCSLRLPEC